MPSPESPAKRTTTVSSESRAVVGDCQVGKVIVAIDVFVDITLENGARGSRFLTISGIATVYPPGYLFLRTDIEHRVASRNPLRLRHALQPAGHRGRNE